ncbi:MAG: T9SS type A sorting domain-containing protein [Bacteroidales bacterium]
MKIRCGMCCVNYDYWPAFDTSYFTITYKFEGDTIIENTSYKKIFYTEAQFPTNWNLGGWIREDENRKVWNRGINYPDVEYLLYDFLMEEGDTLWINDPWEYMILDSVSNVDIDGNLRNKYWFKYPNEPAYAETWTEGIGSNRGIFQIGAAGYDGGTFWLSCQHDNGQLVYMNPASPDCYMFGTGTYELNEQANELRIFPNPATDYISVTSQFDLSIDEANIYNHMGQKVLGTKTVNTTVNISALKPGIYFFEVVKSPEKLRAKFMVVH